MNYAAKRYWLIGASEGLGRALAHKMSAAGAELILSARSETRLQALADALPGPAEVLPLDLADSASVAAAGAKLEWRAGSGHGRHQFHRRIPSS